MNTNLQTVFHYHETTKHSQYRYAKSLGYMDWATQPNPFREYKGTKKIQLPLAFEYATPPYHLLDTNLPPAPLVRESLSQLMQFSMGIAAYKEANGNRWAVRCNASSGNLHPTESYLILPPLFSEQNNSSSVFHYAPKDHSLELLAEFQTQFWDTLPKDSFLLGISSISWREAWKYGERAFRYTQLDAGHAWQSIVVSAKMLGWSVNKLDTISTKEMSKLLGLNQEERFFEDEIPDMILVIAPLHVENACNLQELINTLPLHYSGVANKLSPTMHHWDIIPRIEKATASQQMSQEKTVSPHIQREATYNAKDIILKRRSIHVMKKERSTITKEQFHILLQSITHSLDGLKTSINPVLSIHRVQQYEQGLYILLRDSSVKEDLQQEMKSDFLWEPTAFKNLYMLEKNNMQTSSKAICCSQDIASDGSFSLGMLAPFAGELQRYGAHRYKELHWECGAIGQQLYLEATSLGLSGTGIGCFLDDAMHSLIGLSNNNYQILYHFTIGRGYVDSRIQTKPPY